MTLFELRLCLMAVVALALASIAALASGLTVPGPPRFGRRGAKRRRALEHPGLFPLAEPAIRMGAALLARPRWNRLRAAQATDLRKAGYPLGLTEDEYSALSLLSSIAFGVVVAGYSLLAGTSLVLVMPAAVFGLALPHLQIREIARSRAKEITRGLPHAIEIAALCMGAGLDFPGALRQLTTPLRGADRGALTEELSYVLDDLDLGHTRAEALRSLAERVPTPAVRDFVNAIVQAEQKGNPLAEVLQVQGRMLNMRRSVLAEEAATRAGILMLVPMILLVGCILLLLMGPFLVGGIG